MILALLLALLPPPASQTTHLILGARGAHQPFRPITYEIAPDYPIDYAQIGTVARQPTVSAVKLTVHFTKLEQFFFSHGSSDSPAVLSLWKDYMAFFAFAGVSGQCGEWGTQDYIVQPNSFIGVNEATTYPWVQYSGPGVTHVGPDGLTYDGVILPDGFSFTFTDPETCAWFTGTGRAPIYGGAQGWGTPMYHYAQSTYGPDHQLVNPFWWDAFAFTGFFGEADVEVFQ